MAMRRGALALAVDNTRPEPDELTDGLGLGDPSQDSWQETEDGGADVYLGGASQGSSGEDISTLPFNVNLAEHLDERVMNEMAEELLMGIEADLDSRAPWQELLDLGMELMGFKIDDRTFPFKGAAGVYAPVLAEAVLRTQANWRAEMLPADGPCKTQVMGDLTPDMRERAERVKNRINYQLTDLDESYYPEYDRMLLWIALGGNGFKKVYTDIRKQVVSPMVLPDQLIVNYHATSLKTAERITQLIPTSQAEMIRQQLSGMYRRVDLNQPVDDEDSVVQQAIDRLDRRVNEIKLGDERYLVFECHCLYDIPVQGIEHLDPEGKPSGLPLPFICSIDKNSRKVVGLYRGWEENDPNYATGPERAEYYVHYGMFPGFGFYNYGYAHIMGGVAKAITMLMRQLLDSGTLANFPGGLRIKGMKIDDSTVTIGPCEFKEIDTGGMPIGDAVMALPYKDPSEVLVKLLEWLNEAAQRLGSTMDLQVGEGRQDAPVGSTIAMIEQAIKLMSGCNKRLHVAQRKELRMMAKELGRQPGAVYPWTVDGKQGKTIAEDFAGVDVIPVSDPNTPTHIQRLARADAKLKLAAAAPQIHDQRAAYEDIYAEMGMREQEIMRILPPPQQAQPLDAVTEFQNVLAGKPLAAGDDQDHQSHIATHMQQAKTPGLDKTPAYPALVAHIADHIGRQWKMQTQMALKAQGIQPPAPTQPGQPPDPQVEAKMAVQIAAVADKALASFRVFMDPEMQLKQEENHLKELDLQFKRDDAMRKSRDATEEHKTELIRTAAQIRADAASDASRERVAGLGLQSAQLKAQADTSKATMSTGLALHQMRHDTARHGLDTIASVHDSIATRAGLGVQLYQIASEERQLQTQIQHDNRALALEEKRLPLEHKVADAKLIAARKPHPPASRKK